MRFGCCPLSEAAVMTHEVPYTTDGVPTDQQLSIRVNQINGMFDRFPLPCAVCQTEGFELRVVNPAFSEAVGITRARLRRRALFDVLTPRDGADVDALSEALHRRRSARFPVHVQWTAHTTAFDGEVTVELVDESLLGPLPLLVFLFVGPSRAALEEPPALEPVARQILIQIASGATTAATARAVGLTVDGVNYHVTRLCRRFDVPNRVALVAKAYVLGLLAPTSWPPEAR